MERTCPAVAPDPVFGSHGDGTIIEGIPGLLDKITAATPVPTATPTCCRNGGCLERFR
jgi:hypothetical protein